MRTFAKSIVTAAILLAMAVGGYYAYRRSDARKRGEKYALARAPGDLLHEIESIFASSRRKKAAPTPPAEAAAKPEPSAPKPSNAFEKGRDLYQEGRYEDAIPRLYEAITEAGSSGEQPRELLARARLFLVVLEDTRPDSALTGDPVARFTTASGDSLLVTVNRETDDELSFTKPGGITATLPKSELQDLEVARTDDKKTYLFEAEYRARVENARSALELCDLARFCYACGLRHHLTYLLEKALEAPDDTLQALVAKKHAQAEKAGQPRREALLADLLRHFWSRGEYTKRALPAASPPLGHGDGSPPGSPRPGIEAEPPPTRLGGAGPASGIGGTTTRRPKTKDAELDSLLTKADDLKTRADENYRLAQPGEPDASTHRRAAIDAYRAALALYEKIQDNYGMDFDSTCTEMQRHLYDMLKDTRVR